MYKIKHSITLNFDKNKFSILPPFLQTFFVWRVGKMEEVALEVSLPHTTGLSANMFIMKRS